MCPDKNKTNILVKKKKKLFPQCESDLLTIKKLTHTHVRTVRKRLKVIFGFTSKKSIVCRIKINFNA